MNLKLSLLCFFALLLSGCAGDLSVGSVKEDPLSQSSVKDVGSTGGSSDEGGGDSDGDGSDTGDGSGSDGSSGGSSSGGDGPGDDASEESSSGGGGPGFVPVGEAFVETYFQPNLAASGKVDILFIIDGSISLTEERDQLANSFNVFVDRLPDTVDYNVGVMLAHAGGENSGRLFRGSPSEPLVLKSSEMSLNNIQSILEIRVVWQPTDEATIDGNTVYQVGESDLLSLHNALKQDNFSESQSAGMFRDDAALYLVLVTDEADICFFDHPDNSGSNVVSSSYAQNEPYLSLIQQYGQDLTFEEASYILFCENPSTGDPVFTPGTLYNQLLERRSGAPLLTTGLMYTGGNQVPTGCGQQQRDELGAGYLEFLSRSAFNFNIDLADPGDDPNSPEACEPNPERLADEFEAAGDFLYESLFDVQNVFPLATTNADPNSINVLVDAFPLSNFMFDYDVLTNSVTIQSGHQGGPLSRIDIIGLGGEPVE